MKLQYRARSPDRAYVSNNLLIPRNRVAEQSIKNSLEFLIGTEPVIEEATGECLATIPRVVRLWDQTDTHLIVPRGFIGPHNYNKYLFEVIEEPVEFQETNVQCRAVPRDESQQRALDAMLNHRDGTINLACGGGKTVVALMAIAALRVPAIVVVNSKNLIAQWKEEIAEHLTAGSVGTVMGDRDDWEDRDIVLATIQTLASRREGLPAAFRRRFGVAIYDEGHHMSAPVFVKGADLFYGRRFALTATANRTDGLEAIYQYHLGAVIFKDLTQDVIPRTVFHALDWAFPQEDLHRIRDCNGMFNMSKLHGYLGTLEWRNHLIAESIERDMQDKRVILVLSHSKDHIQLLARRFGTNNCITGDIADENERLRILRACNPVFGTFHLTREALNKKSLDDLYVTTPFSNSNDLQQAWGRIQREFEGKREPIVHVFEDRPIKNCVKSCGALRKFLKVLRYPFERIVTTIGDKPCRQL